MYTERIVDKFKSISNKVQNKTMKTKWKANKKLKHNLVLMAVWWRVIAIAAAAVAGDDSKNKNHNSVLVRVCVCVL